MREKSKLLSKIAGERLKRLIKESKYQRRKNLPSRSEQKRGRLAGG